MIGPKVPTKSVEKMLIIKLENEWDEYDFRLKQLNAKVMNLLYCALDVVEFDRILSCESTKEIWDKLELTHEGTNQVNESKINLLIHDYEMFKMKTEESISEMFSRFTNIINGLKCFEKGYYNNE